MKITAAFVLGVIVAGLAIYKAPRVRWFRDEPITPEGWQPKLRQWRDGEEIPWSSES